MDFALTRIDNTAHEIPVNPQNRSRLAVDRRLPTVEALGQHKQLTAWGIDRNTDVPRPIGQDRRRAGEARIQFERLFGQGGRFEGDDRQVALGIRRLSRMGDEPGAG
jgi:hypothetical protein